MAWRSRSAGGFSVSWARAVQTGAWTAFEIPRAEPRFDFDLIHRYVKIAIEHRLGWERWFDAQAIVPVPVSYEDLVADHDTVVRRVLKEIGIAVPSDTSFTTNGISRQADVVNEAWMGRYRELVGRDRGDGKVA